MKHTFFICFTVILLCNSIQVKAEPGAYYNGIDSSKSCAAFKTILFNLISNDSHLQYSYVDDNYYRTDQKPNENGSGFVLVDRYCSENPNGLDYCSFTGVAGSCGGTTFCQCYNKEHVIPRAWFNGSNNFSIMEYTDMHYLWPADARTNNAKNNFPIGYTKSPIYLTSLNGATIGVSDQTKNFSYSSTDVFEPNDAFKGDFARAYLYFVTRYQDSVPSFRRNNIAVNVFSNAIYPGLQPWILQLCVKWHKQDLPDDFERKRNDSVFAIQGNRNPYVDYPHWVEKVFGDDGISTSCVPTAVKNIYSVNYSVFPNPVTDDLLNISIGTLTNKNVIIEVTDILGRKKLSQETDISKNTLQISTHNWENGLYFINVIYDGINNVQTIIKQ